METDATRPGIVFSMRTGLLLASVSLALTACDTPPPLPKVPSSAPEQAINTPDGAAILQERYGK